jgi:hypothetical protein
MKPPPSKAVEMTGYGKTGKPKAGFPLFPSRFPSIKNSERRISLNAGFPVVQAHRSIRICWPVPTWDRNVETDNARKKN